MKKRKSCIKLVFQVLITEVLITTSMHYTGVGWGVVGGGVRRWFSLLCACSLLKGFGVGSRCVGDGDEDGSGDRDGDRCL